MDKKRILLVDDEPDVTQLLKLCLEKTGAYEVREENRGERALVTARAFKPDLILLDVMMPAMDGGQVAAQLKADEKLKNTPVVFLSAVVAKEEAQKQQGMIGGHPFIAKPASPEEVTTAIEKYLSKGKDLTPMREKTSERNEARLRAKKRILLIDDDPDLTGLLKIYLENTGTYEVKEENNSEHAVATARAFRPDLIFLDMMMPNVLGGKVAGQLEAEEDLKHTPVVFLSAVVTEDATGHETKIAGRPAVAKPVTPDTLVSLIEKYLPKKILLVDDDDNESARLKINIERTTDYEALVAATGEAALMLVKTRNPDFVLLNTRMPAMDGLEMLKRINAIAPGIPVAMMTDVHKPGEAKQYIDAGALDYITKPIDLEHLKATLLASLSS